MIENILVDRFRVYSPSQSSIHVLGLIQLCVWYGIQSVPTYLPTYKCLKNWLQNALNH